MTDPLVPTDENTAETAAAMATVLSASEMPPEITDYLVDMALQDHAPVYLQLTAEGHLISSGGHLQKYGLGAIAPGDYIGETFYYLEGFFPLAQTEIMQHLQLDCGPVVDVHVVSTGNGAGWVLLLNTTAEAHRVQRLQQKGNDLSLLRQQYAKLLNQNVAPSQQSKSVSGKMAMPLEHKAQTVSVLIVKFCGPQAEQLSIGKPSILRAVNASMSFITQVIVEEGGLINHILGGTAAAFFGLLPSQQAAPQQAIYAARRVLKRLMAQPNDTLLSLADAALAAEGAATQQARLLGIGASITSGEAAAGILPGQGSRRLNAVGDPIQAAVQMSRYIHPGTIILDLATYETVQQCQGEFQDLKVTAGPLSEADRKFDLRTKLYRFRFK